MTQSLSGSGQTFCSPRGLSGPPPSAVCTPAMEAGMELFGKREVAAVAAMVVVVLMMIGGGRGGGRTDRKLRRRQW